MKLGNSHSLQRNKYNDVSSFQSGQEKVLSDDALKALTAYHWPGYVRELENCLERTYALAAVQ